MAAWLTCLSYNGRTIDPCMYLAYNNIPYWNYFLTGFGPGFTDAM